MLQEKNKVFENVLIIGTVAHVNEFIEVAGKYRSKNALIEFDYDESQIGASRQQKVSFCDTLYVINVDQQITPLMEQAIEQATELEKQILYFEPVLPDRLPIITICGSLRFKEKIEKLAMRLTMEGNIVLTPLLDVHGSITATDHGISDKVMYNIIHRVHDWKIEICDKVLVANFDDYVGDDTLREINYARSIGKKIEYVHVMGLPPDARKGD